jgi:endonuclease/exonuclease/phosphatase family metal-dependent hydrolase
MRVLVAVLLLVAGCSSATGSGSSSPSDKVVRVVNLNAAMGYRAGKGDPAGTDATREDLGLLARDIVDNLGDVANLQEMALPAARELRTILGGMTGDEWQLNWAHAASSTFYPGKSRDEGPAYEDVSTGNAQLVRIGDGIARQQPITLDDVNDDQGIVLPSGGRAFMGAEITLAGGGVVDVYNTHLALARQVSDTERAADVRRIQETTESRANPVIVTGDFNQTIGVPDPSQQTMAAIQAFLDYGYADVAAKLGATIDQKQPEKDSRRIDYIFARGVPTADVVRFVSDESDHWGLAVSVL